MKKFHSAKILPCFDTPENAVTNNRALRMWPTVLIAEGLVDCAVLRAGNLVNSARRRDWEI